MLHNLNISRQSLLRAAIFAASIIIVYLALPDKTEVKFSYQEGKLWNYDAVVTSVDLDVFNDPDRQKAIEDSMKAEYKPVYYHDEAIANDAINRFSHQINQSPSLRNAPAKKTALISALRNIYHTGIIDSRGAALPSGVRIRTSNSDLRNQPSSDFYTFASAHEALRRASSGDSEAHEALMAIQLDIRPNVIFDSVINNQALADIESFAHAAIGKIPGGTKIIDRGETITPRVYNILQTYEARAAEAAKQKAASTRMASSMGTLIVLLSLFLLLFAYLKLLRADYFENLRVVGLLCITVVGFTLLSFAMNAAFDAGIYMVPFAIVPIILLVFLDSRTAFFAYMITLLMCAATNHFMWDFMLLEFTAGFVALITIREMSKRSQLVQTSAAIFVVYSLLYIGIEFMQTAKFDSLSGQMFKAFAINAVFISLAYFVIFLIEKTFGFISRVTLVELSDINHPLLRELSRECPGTFQHSMAVSNMAADAASRLGANVQLVRAGALYHDIGKINNPAFFTENQHGVNPHDKLSPIQSARIVIQHVRDGAQRAEKEKLPSQLRDFILQHHGKGKARYFYTTYCNAHPGETPDPTAFTYPGPNPQSLESSILMMADAVEAASRSLKDHSAQSIQALVDKIIDTQVAEGLHNDSPISFRDITRIKESFASTLRTMYHSRISYPESTIPAPSQSNTQTPQQ